MINCLSYALRFWNTNKYYKILYNSDHVINVPINTNVLGFLDLKEFGEDYFLKAFDGLLNDSDKLILNKYLNK